MKVIRYVCALAKAYIPFALRVVKFEATRPWIVARFYVAWAEYQRGKVYKERLFNFGLRQAIFSFVEDKWARNYCFKIATRKDPLLKWRVLFAPFSIERPTLLMLAAENGYLKDKASH